MLWIARYTIAMKNDTGITVGHLPQNIMCYENNTDLNQAKCDIKILEIKISYTVNLNLLCALVCVLLESFIKFLANPYYMTTIMVHDMNISMERWVVFASH